MKFYKLIFLSFMTFLLSYPCATLMGSPNGPEMEKQISRIIKHMTLEEKIGQMTQLTISTILNDSSTSAPVIDEEKLNEIIGKYKVGSILNVPTDRAVKPEVWKSVIKRIQEISMEKIGIPCIYGVDQIHGASYTDGATLFPQNINLAATGNRRLVKHISEIAAYESRACNIPWVFAPVMDLGRNPRWSRMWESYGEDVYLNKEMARESVLGFQGETRRHIDNHHVASCIKHFMAYGVPVSGHDRTPSSVTGRTLREKFFEPFRECIANGALSLMVSSSSNDGIPFHANKELLTGWLKDEMKWDGVIVTDWNDINFLCDRDHIAANRKEAVEIAINAGIDMSMVPLSCDFCEYLHELVGEGKVKMSRIDDAVRRVLRLKYRLGLFEPQEDYSYDKFASAESEKLSYQAAVESIVLLKNEKEILPLGKGTKIMVTGPNANSMRCLNGGWSYSWQGNLCDSYAQGYNTIYEALKKKFDCVSLQQGVIYGSEYDNWKTEYIEDMDKTLKQAEECDVIVACIGENSYCETPGNINDLRLSENQRRLVKRLSETGKPIVMVLNGGRPRIINDIEQYADAVVDIMLPGNKGGDALASLFAGEENFSGRLPFTYPRWPDATIPYDHKPCEKMNQIEGEYNYSATIDVQWPFGYGLSYTKFEYSDFLTDKKSFKHSDNITFTISVKNVGKCTGKEIIQLWSSDLVASVSPDVIRMRGFEKIELEPGESATVSITIPASDLAFVGMDGKWRLEEGDFNIKMGNLNTRIRCTEDFVWKTPNIEK